MPERKEPKSEPPPKEEVTPFERMRRLTGAVIRVPKAEVAEPKRKKRAGH